MFVRPVALVHAWFACWRILSNQHVYALDVIAACQQVEEVALEVEFRNRLLLGFEELVKFIEELRNRLPLLRRVRIYPSGDRTFLEHQQRQLMKGLGELEIKFYDYCHFEMRYR